MKQSKKFIKFVIPCWGVEKTIGKMLDSILSQTFTDYHVVCVEDCSLDKTWQVLQKYKEKFPDKITLIKNPKNLGAAESRNQGYIQTKESIPSEYLWVVDGDDYLADKDVLKDIYEFATKNTNLDIINIGLVFKNKYYVGKLGWPIASWGRVIRPSAYVQSPSKNIPYGNDVYSHFVMFDKVDDSRIGSYDRKCYICPEAGQHRNSTEKNMNVPKAVGDLLMQHEFRKDAVANAIKTSEAGTWRWLLSGNPKFHPIVKRKVSILMASFPYRKKWMLQCIERLIPQCDNFYLWLNEYKEIPEELKKFDQKKLHVTLGQKNLKENGRYTFLTRPELQNDYCFICDDDINWPKDYVKNTIECFKRNGDNILIAYFINGGLNALHLHDEVKTGYSTFANVPHYRFGAGTCVFVPSIAKFQFTMDELVAHYDLELFFAYQCLAKGIRLIAPKRASNWISFICDGKHQCAIEKYALFRSNIQQRIKRTYNYMKQKGMIPSKVPESRHTISNDVKRFQFG